MGGCFVIKCNLCASTKRTAYHQRTILYHIKTFKSIAEG